MVRGQCPFYDFLAHFDKEDLYTTEFSTVGGLILDRLEHIPHEGETLTWNTLRFRILKMDDTRIDSVLVKLM